MAIELETEAEWMRGTPQERIMGQVREAIRTGRLRPGERLEAREEYVRAFSVNPLTVQRAFSRLLRDQFVVTRNRIGTFVAGRPPNLFNIGLVFDLPRDEAWGSRFFQSLSRLADDQDPDAEQTLIPYYGLRGPNESADRARLADDLANDRLAAVFWVCGPKALPSDPRFHQPWIPSIFIHTSGLPESPHPCLRTEPFFPHAVEEAARRGFRRPAVLLLTNGEQPTPAMRERLHADFQRSGLEVRPHWMHAATWENPFWGGQIVETLFRLPPTDRPDSLIVADDNLLSEAVAGLTRAGVAGQVRLLAHANIPFHDPLPFPAVRIGIDCREVLRVALATLDQRRRTPDEPPARPVISLRVVDENTPPATI